MRQVSLPLVSVLFLASLAEAQSTTRVSVASDGMQGIGNSSTFIRPSMSADGRFVAFQSWATNLVPGDTNGVSDIFVHDRQTGETTRISLAPGGVQIAAQSERPFMSANGRFVVYDSGSAVLVPGDINNQQDVFVFDRDTGITTLESIASTGAQGNNASQWASISGDGRFVVFQSGATNLVPDDTNGLADIFVRDRLLGITKRVNVSSDGVQANNATNSPMISADGRIVTFSSAATNLVPGDTNATWDIFAHDLLTSQTTRVSVSSSGVAGNGPSLYVAPASADGRFVAFGSLANNLVDGDTNGVFDIFVHDRQTGVTTRENIPAGGGQANNASFDPWLSADGRYAAFYSFANNLVAGDTNSKQDVFVRDRLLGVTTRESVSTRGAQANGDSDSVVISGDGRFLAFPSQASNLVEGDTNGAFDVFVRDLGHSIVGDLNGDGQVNGADLGMLLAQWGPCAGCSADLNGDGVVNGVDLGALLANWT